MAGFRIPGVLGLTVVPSASSDDGTLARTAMPQPGPVGSGEVPEAAAPETVDEIDLDKVIEHLDANAHKTSQGRCARYVRQALEAGGAKIPIASRPLYAKDYGPTLEGLGFQKVDPEGYVPQPGDVVVLQPPSGRTAGHIQIWNGTRWVSDFEQGTDIYPGASYRKEKVAYEIFRYNRPLRPKFRGLMSVP